MVVIVQLIRRTLKEGELTNNFGVKKGLHSACTLNELTEEERKGNEGWGKGGKQEEWQSWK